MEIKSKSKEERKKIIRHKVDENTSNFSTGVVKKRHHFQLKKEATLEKKEMTKDTTLPHTSKKQVKATKLEQKFKLTALEANNNMIKTTGKFNGMKIISYLETVQVNRKLMAMKI